MTVELPSSLPSPDYTPTTLYAETCLLLLTCYQPFILHIKKGV